jgi:hypothetical protein
MKLRKNSKTSGRESRGENIELSTLILNDSHWVPGPSAKKIKTELSKEAMEAIQFASKIIPTQESFMAILYSYEAMGRALVEYADARKKALEKSRIADDGIFFGQAKVNFTFTSALAATRTYIDRTKAEVLRLEGYDNSAENYHRFSSFISEFYDNDWRYRVADKLRNFSEHYDLPMSNMNLSFNARTREELKLDPWVSADNLLRTKFKWTNKVRSDLEKCEQGLFIVPLVAFYAKCAQSIHNFFFGLYEKDFSRHEAWINRFKKRFQPIGAEYLVYIKTDPTTGKRPISLFPFIEFKTVRDCQETINKQQFFDVLASREVKVPSNYEDRMPVIPPSM